MDDSYIKINKDIRNAILNNKPIVINGPNSRIDFTYVEDLAKGYELVINSKNSINQIFNLTRGNARSLMDAANIIKKYFPDLKIIKKKHEKGVPKRGTLSVTKAKKLLKFNPKFDLEIGIKKYLDYYKSR